MNKQSAFLSIKPQHEAFHKGRHASHKSFRACYYLFVTQKHAFFSDNRLNLWRFVTRESA